MWQHVLALGTTIFYGNWCSVIRPMISINMTSTQTTTIYLRTEEALFIHNARILLF